jgi:hypothetical protein
LKKKTDPLRLQRDAESKRTKAIANRDSMAERLRTAEAAVVSHRQIARELAANGGDDAAISAAESKMRSQEDRAVTLRAAISDVESVITGHEREIASIIDQRMRVETNGAVLEMADELEVLFGDFDNVARALQEADAWEAGSSLMSPDVGDVRSLVVKVREGLQIASVHALASLKSHAAAVLAGTARPSLPQRPAPAPELEVVAPMPTLTLIPTKKLRYTDASGAVIVCGAYRQHAFPQPLGELALRTNVAVALNDKRVRDFQAAGFATVGTPTEESCEWLGTPGREPAPRFMKPGPPPIHSSLTSFTPSGAGPFTVVDRGPAIIGTMPARPIEAMGARKQADES